MRSNLIAAIAAVSIALATPALAGDNHHWNGNRGGGYHTGGYPLPLPTRKNYRLTAVVNLASRLPRR